MESVLERISREHDQERKRLELVFELEKARQKEELRKRKERKRREKLAKKQRKKDDALDAPPKEDGEASAQPLPAPVSSRVAEKVESKAHLSLMVPGHGRIDLSQLLSDDHATRHRQLKGVSPAHERAMLNPATLRYLTEQMAMKQPAVLGQQVRRELVLEELADEK
jgi:hypothetical protein